MKVKLLTFVDRTAITSFGAYVITHRVMKQWVVAFYPMLENINRKNAAVAYKYKQVIGENLASEAEAANVAQEHWRTSILSALEQT